MTALAQGSAGVAFVMCFALLLTRQVPAAAVLLAVQSVAVAMIAAVLNQPLMAIPPLLLSAGFWLLQRATNLFHTETAPIGGAKLGIAAGAILAALCQSEGNLALPAAIILLATLLATTRSHPLMQIVALIAAQNGLAMAACVVTQATDLTVAALTVAPFTGAPFTGAPFTGAPFTGAALTVSPLVGTSLGVPHYPSAPFTIATLAAALLTPVACLLLPLPLAAGLLAPAVATLPNRSARRQASPRLRRLIPAVTTAWFEWIDIALALAMFAATIFVPLGSLASIFAPLFGLDGLLRSSVRRNRPTLTPLLRAAALLQSGFIVLMVCAPNLMVAWLAVLAAMAMALLPPMPRRWSTAVLAFIAAAISLFGLLLLPAVPSILAYFSLFAGFAMIAATVPDLAIALVVLLLRFGIQTPWPPGVEALGVGIATVALLGCAILLINAGRSRRTTLLILAQASIAALTICIDQAEGRFAALVLLILLTLSQAAARVTVGPVAALAVAGLGGLPPLGVFPGLVLAVLSIGTHAPWLLILVGGALIATVTASLPRNLSDCLPRKTIAPNAQRLTEFMPERPADVTTAGQPHAEHPSTSPPAESPPAIPIAASAPDGPMPKGRWPKWLRSLAPAGWLRSPPSAAVLPNTPSAPGQPNSPFIALPSTPSATTRPRETALLPDRLATRTTRWLTKIPSIAWLPLLLALAVGYLAPTSVIYLWRILTAGRA